MPLGAGQGTGTAGQATDAFVTPVKRVTSPGWRSVWQSWIASRSGTLTTGGRGGCAVSPSVGTFGQIVGWRDGGGLGTMTGQSCSFGRLASEKQAGVVQGVVAVGQVVDAQ